MVGFAWPVAVISVVVVAFHGQYPIGRGEACESGYEWLQFGSFACDNIAGEYNQVGLQGIDFIDYLGNEVGVMTK